MNSCLYRARVMHHRILPGQHRFFYHVFMFYIDLGELPLLTSKLWMFSHNRINFFSFRDREHLQLPANAPDHSKSTREHILTFLQENGVTGVQKIMLLTNLNVLGYNFNPVSFYFCFDEQQIPLCCIAEVSNTFKEMKPYLITPGTVDRSQFILRTKKYFYVSPFMDHDTDFHFNVTVPDGKLNIRIDNYKDEKRSFISTLTGEKNSLSNRYLVWYSIRFPFITLKVIVLIHWNALRLWLKGLPYHPKAENQHLQRNVYRKYGEKK